MCDLVSRFIIRLCVTVFRVHQTNPVFSSPVYETFSFLTSVGLKLAT